MGTNIDALTDEQLASADRTIDDMLSNYVAKLASPKAAKNKSLASNPPRMNPIFGELQAEIKTEVLKRNSKNAT